MEAKRFATRLRSRTMGSRAYLRVRTILDRPVRRRFEAAVREAPPGSLRIVVGSSRIPVEGWIESEQSFLDLVDSGTWERYFRPDSIDAILAEHVWEHLDPHAGGVAASTCFRYLRPGGYLRIAVPDGHHPDPAYIKEVEPGGTGCGASDHKVLYTAESLTTLLSGTGFEPRLLEYFDANGVFHEAPWDPAAGMIRRSRRFDPRNRRRLAYTSLITDAFKSG
jgi:predicted SAM-dependent methyltransferase